MSLEEKLLSPDPGKNKWPWIHETPPPAAVPGIVYPKITVVTPSYNQGRFIEETILSVLHQNYPNLEYIVMDGGSNDETVEVLKKYDARIDFWGSEKDKGQSDAINKGFQRATGDIICWLNSDDYYFPGTLFKVAEKLKAGEKALFFGETLHINEHTGHSYKSRAAQKHLSYDLKLHDYLIQPSSFWTKRCWDEIGALSPDLHFIFDWDWFIRAQAQGVRYLSTDEVFSVYRIHEQHKSGTGGDKRMNEIRKIYEMYSAPEYAALFDYVRANRPAIDRLMTKLVKIRLSRFYVPILCVFFPELFFKYRKLKLRDIIEMG